MHSATKQHVPREKIDIMVKKAFGCKAIEVTEMKEGFFNAIYSVLLETGKRVVLKVAPHASVRVMNYEKNIMYTEVSVLQKMKNHAKVQVPDMYYYDAAKTVVDSAYFFMEHLSGDNYNAVRSSLSREVQAQIDEQLGKNNRIINDIRGSRFGYFGQRSRQKKEWYLAFRDMLEDILEDVKYYEIDLEYKADTFLQMLEDDRELFDEVKQPCLVHWDLWDGNVFVKDGQLQGIIDWERCLWGDPLMEYGFRTHHHNEAFYRGYGITPFTPNQDQRVRWYDLYLCITLIVEYYCRDYKDEAFYTNVWKQYRDAITHLH